MGNENQKLKEWCYKELEIARRICKNREEMKTYCSLCLGAVQYAQFIGLVKYEEVNIWWDDIREEFWFGKFGS